MGEPIAAMEVAPAEVAPAEVVAVAPVAAEGARRDAAGAAAAVVPPLVVEAEHEVVGGNIAKELNEVAAEVIGTITRVVASLGEQDARQLVVRTWQAEERGGLQTADGTCRRLLPGAVFAWHVTQAATPLQKAQIWPPSPQTAPQRAPEPMPRPAPTPPRPAPRPTPSPAVEAATAAQPRGQQAYRAPGHAPPPDFAQVDAKELEEEDLDVWQPIPGNTAAAAAAEAAAEAEAGEAEAEVAAEVAAEVEAEVAAEAAAEVAAEAAAEVVAAVEAEAAATAAQAEVVPAGELAEAMAATTQTFDSLPSGLLIRVAHALMRIDRRAAFRLSMSTRRLRALALGDSAWEAMLRDVKAAAAVAVILEALRNFLDKFASDLCRRDARLAVPGEVALQEQCRTIHAKLDRLGPRACSLDEWYKVDGYLAANLKTRRGGAPAGPGPAMANTAATFDAVSHFVAGTPLLTFVIAPRQP